MTKDDVLKTERTKLNGFASLQNKPGTPVFKIRPFLLDGFAQQERNSTLTTTIAGTIKLIHNNQPMHMNMQHTVLTGFV